MGDVALASELMRLGIRDQRVLEAIASLERSQFVPPEVRDRALEDGPLPIGFGQTISQPYVVALMTEALELKGGERVLEIGTGSGYQTAVLAQLCREVYSVEIVEPLAERAADRLAGFPNVHLRRGDGRLGWPDHQPYDAVLVTAAPERLPEALLAQLKVGGRMVAPVGAGEREQKLLRITRLEDDVRIENLLPVRFVPLTAREWTH